MYSEELLKEYPKAALVVKQWLLNQLLESLKDESVPEEFKQQIITDGIEDERIAALIDANPRSLLDFFDHHNVIIIINYHPNFGFSFSVEENEQNDFFTNRKEAEKKAIEAAFEILNQEL